MANKVKVSYMMFQNPPKGVTPVEIISARTQTNNISSDFTDNTVIAARYVVKNISNMYFLNFGVYGVTHDII